MPKGMYKRLTKEEKDKKAKFKADEDRLRNYFSKINSVLSDMRSKERDFHGLDRELKYFQRFIELEYQKTRDIGHPRDLGTAREVIIRDFFINSGLLPKKYSISRKSARVCSTSGHISKEIDLLFYDANESISLMRRNETYEVYPVENVYGILQIKSKLTKGELLSGLDNIASFKKLKKLSNNSIVISDRVVSHKGFGVIFAYESDLDWEYIVDELNDYSKNANMETMINALFIMNKGLFLFGNKNSVLSFNSDEMAKISDLQVHGRPDRDGNSLWTFYSIIMELLEGTFTVTPRFLNYHRLPLIAGDYSYEYILGVFNELGHCDQHSDYQRKIKTDKLEQVINYCKGQKPINWVKAMKIAYGLDDNNEEAYKRQPETVVIYNPENRPLSEVLTMETVKTDDSGNETKNIVVAYDGIRSEGMNILIPYYYSVKESIFQECPLCKKDMKNNFSQ